ncbi:MAG TPA: hypothetical protein VMX35_08475 [Acidobacteriota bacterium]|nr:hypothetical protein [Acidobacteriota bacterium]
MRKYIIIPAITLFLFFVACTGLCADEQSFSISRNVEYDNYPVRVAVNTDTGDILVVWLNIKTADNKRLYAALCKLSKSGKFKVRKARMLSGTESFIWNFDIAYNPLDKSYMGVCDAYEDGYNTPMNLWSLKLDSKGKPVGQPIQLTPTGTSFLCPAITFVPGIPATPPSAKGNFLIAYDRPAKKLESDQPGVYTRFLDHNGNLTASVPQFVSQEINWQGVESFGSLPQELISLEGGGFVLALRKKNDNGNGSGFLLRLGPFGQAIKQVELGDYISMQVEFIQLSNKICVLSWDDLGSFGGPGYQLPWWNEGECYNQLYRPSLKKVRKFFYPLGDDKAYITELVKLNDDPGGYQLASDGQFLLGRYINQKGKLGPKTTSLFDHQNMLYMMDAACLPGGNRVFVAWVEKGDALGVGGRAGNADYHSEVKGLVFDAVPQD